ncbi:hypothetical protein OBBRIDRAFT_885648 [Obba rivulosa]|uniref:C2H2-type domain-containing protein n=1 Tax=Obba rivulosa TaxID=1052685 RepID=A0A8E2DP99_9APHY|nr:hypothetical protein OBBRIDRAFT_885648 [Obba rivulosa]
MSLNMNSEFINFIVIDSLNPSFELALETCPVNQVPPSPFDEGASESIGTQMYRRLPEVWMAEPSRPIYNPDFVLGFASDAWDVGSGFSSGLSTHSEHRQLRSSGGYSVRSSSRTRSRAIAVPLGSRCLPPMQIPKRFVRILLAFSDLQGGVGINPIWQVLAGICRAICRHRRCESVGAALTRFGICFWLVLTGTASTLDGRGPHFPPAASGIPTDSLLSSEKPGGRGNLVRRTVIFSQLSRRDHGFPDSVDKHLRSHKQDFAALTEVQGTIKVKCPWEDGCATEPMGRENLSRHMHKHFGSNKHECDICGAVISRAETLNRHQQSQHCQAVAAQHASDEAQRSERSASPL